MRTTRRGAARALACVLLLGLVVPVVANAAKITLVGGIRPVVQSKVRCTDSTLTVSPATTGSTVTGVKVTGFTAKAGVTCAVATVRLYSTTTKATAYTGTGTPAATFTTAAGTAFTPPPTAAGRVSVTIDGWPVPAVWQNTPAVAGNCAAPSGASYEGAVKASTSPPCSVTKLDYNAWEGTTYGVAFTIKNTSTQTITWSLALDLSARPTFPAINPKSFAGIKFDSSWNAYADDACASLPVVLLKGKEPSDQDELAPGQSRQYSFQVSSQSMAGWWSCTLP